MTTANAEWGNTAGRSSSTSQMSQGWWLFLITGVCWFIFAFIVLSFSYTTVWAIAAFFGVALMIVGVSEFLIAAVTPDWKWAHAILGVAAIGVGIAALAWPEAAFSVASTLIGWYLLFRGIADIVISLATRDANDLWWLQLIAGVVQIGVGAWAVGYPGRSMVLLAVWVGIVALAKGFTDIALAFQVKRD